MFGRRQLRLAASLRLGDPVEILVIPFVYLGILVNYIVVYIIVAITASIVAGNKGRSRAGWFFLCLLLTPFAILVLLALPTREGIGVRHG